MGAVTLHPSCQGDGRNTLMTIRGSACHSPEGWGDWRQFLPSCRHGSAAVPVVVLQLRNAERVLRVLSPLYVLSWKGGF